MAAAEAAASSSSVMQTDTKMKYVCTYCDIQSSTATGLNTHVMGVLHRRKLAEECPAKVPHIKSLQEFLYTYMKDDAILGLQHVVEVQVGNYLYICRLCSVILHRPGMIRHLCGSSHLERYLELHHPKAFYFMGEFAGNGGMENTIRSHAGKLHRQWGKGRMKEIKIDAKGPTPAKVARHASNENDLSIKSNTFPRGMLSGFLLRDRWKCLNDTPFKHNEEFVDYMRHFEMQNDEDAALVKIVIQNCNKALTKFQGEQANVAVAQGSPAASHRAPAPTGRADPECVSHSPETVDESVPVASQGADSPSLEPEIFRNIKNMEASQVRSVFEKIASTHPAFRGINLLNVIRCLQETGRLKKS